MPNDVLDSKLNARLKENRGMSRKRRIQDGSKNVFTYLSALLAVFVLGSVVFYIFSNGWKSLSWDLIMSDYWNVPYNVEFQENKAENFPVPSDLAEDEFFSSNFGIGLKNGRNPSGEKIVELTHIDGASAFHQTISKTAGANKGQNISVDKGSDIKSLYYVNAEGESKYVGVRDAKTTIEKLDNDAVAMESVAFNSPGGGIRGSIVATLMLILITLIIALPIGVFAAIYLHEIAYDTPSTRAIRSAVEMLNGVPSIIYGLMGMTVLFPITQVFGASTPNVLLGGLTMSIVLLPVVIRQTEEALITVPDSLRMGSLALGATKTQTIFRVVLPNALPGILSAGLLSVSRVIGESAALIYTMGTAVSDNPTWTGSGTSLALQIWSVMSGEQPNFALASAISILILIVVLALNITVRLISKQLNKRWA